MEPIVIGAFITGAVGIVTGLLTFQSTRLSIKTQRRQADNQNTLDSVNLRLEHWTELVTSLREEIARQDAVIEIERGRNEALQETIDHLRERLQSGESDES